MLLFGKKKTAEVNEPMDLDAVMKKFDRESNVRIWEGKPKFFVSCLLAAFALFCAIEILWLNRLEEHRLTMFVAFVTMLGYIVFPARKGVQKVNYMPWYDIVLMVLGTGAFLYFTFNAVEIIQQGSKFELYQIIIGIIGIISVTEVCRRSVGLPIVIVAACFIVYAMVFGLHNPSFMKKLNYLVRNLFYTKEGILSTPINACSKFIVIFIIFGSFLERSGVADFFIKISNAIVGGFSGGPAKVAVVASALEGMVSGSSVANTVGSGSVTIPLMKKTGYKPEFAAAAEASASTGGQIMPPIMGAAAFLMADFLGAPYSVILLCAIIPAVLYFAGVFITVHLEAKKEGLRGLTKEELPKIKPLLKELYLLIPLILLIYLVTSNKCTIQFAAALSIGAVILVSIASILINKKETTFVGFIKKMVKDIFDALSSGGQGVITVAAACAVAGIISGVITMTGLANILFNGIVALAGNQVIIALFLTMICCIVLGMGVPTTANYCIMAATCAPILIRMGVPQIAAHFFVFYFGIVADLTPPVALAAYAGAAIAQANPMKTAVTATKLAIGAFIIPYIFALNPTLLVALCGPEVISETLNMTISVTAVDVIIICITSLVGMFAVSASLEGYMMHRMSWYERIMSVAGGLLLIYPGLTTDIIGLALVVAVVLLQLATRKKYAVNV